MRPFGPFCIKERSTLQEVTPRPAAPDDLPAILALGGQVFRGSAEYEPSVASMFEHLFHESNAENLTVAEVDGAIRALVGAVHSTVQIGSASLKVASLGFVCCDEAYRGRGLATNCLEFTAERARRAGAHLLWISGDRGLYLRMGCRPGAPVWRFEVERTALSVSPPRWLQVDFDCQEISALCGLHALEPVRFIRTPHTFQRLLNSWRSGTGDRNQMRRAVALARRAGVPMAWMAYTVFEEEGAAVLDAAETAGDRLSAAFLLTALAERFSVQKLRLLAPAHERAWPTHLERATGASWDAQAAAMPSHTFRVLSAGELAAALRPYLQQTGDEQTLAFLSRAAEPATNEQAAGLTEYLFAPQEGHLARIPLPTSGLNYV